MSFGKYVVRRLIKERNYNYLAYLIVSRLEELVEMLGRVFPREREESLREIAIQLKREAMDRLSHPQMNICPYCLSRKVENLDFVYKCLECSKTFSKGWKDERLVEVVNALYSYLKSNGMSDKEIKRYLFDVFGIVLRGARREHHYCSEIEVLNLVSSTFLALYDDPYLETNSSRKLKRLKKLEKRSLRRNPKKKKRLKGKRK